MSAALSEDLLSSLLIIVVLAILRRVPSYREVLAIPCGGFEVPGLEGAANSASAKMYSKPQPQLAAWLA